MMARLSVPMEFSKHCESQYHLNGVQNDTYPVSFDKSIPFHGNIGFFSSIKMSYYDNS